MKKIAASLCIIFAFAFIAAQSLELSYYQEFDKNGNVIYEKDAFGYEGFGKYDKDGNQTYYKSTINGETNAEGWFTYYKNGEFESCHVIDGTEEWFYLYDKNGNIYYLKTPSGETYNYYYDKYGRNRFAISSSGEKVFFAYTDDVVYAKYVSNDNTIHYTYDPDGNLISSYAMDGKIDSFIGDESDESSYEDDEYSYSGYDEDDYDWYDDYYDENFEGYDYGDYDDDTYEEYDAHGNITLRKTSYYTEKYVYTYYLDGSVQSVACYEDYAY